MLARTTFGLAILLLLPLPVVVSAIPITEDSEEPTAEQLQRTKDAFARIGGTYQASNSTVPENIKHRFLFPNGPKAGELKTFPQPSFHFGLDFGVLPVTNPLSFIRQQGYSEPHPPLKVPDEIVGELKPFSMNLRSLGLHGPEVVDASLKGLNDLPNLRQLNLGFTSVTDAGLKEVMGLQNLAFLGLYKTRVTNASLTELKSLTNLTYLDLRDTGVTDAGLKHLTAFENLTFLGLDSIPVTDAGLSELRGLKSLTLLTLRKTRVTGASGKVLKGFKNLAHLDLRGTEVTDEMAAELKRALPACEVRK